MSDDLAPTLAGYRERDRLTALGHPGNPEDVPRLLAAGKAEQ